MRDINSVSGTEQRNGAIQKEGEYSQCITLKEIRESFLVHHMKKGGIISCDSNRIFGNVMRRQRK